MSSTHGYWKIVDSVAEGGGSIVLTTPVGESAANVYNQIYIPIDDGVIETWIDGVKREDASWTAIPFLYGPGHKLNRFGIGMGNASETQTPWMNTEPLAIQWDDASLSLSKPKTPDWAQAHHAKPTGTGTHIRTGFGTFKYQ